MGEGCREGQRLGDRHVMLEPVFNSAYNMGVTSTLEEPNVPENAGIKATTSNGTLTVYKARCNF
jgi:hypothetical protein